MGETIVKNSAVTILDAISTLGAADLSGVLVEQLSVLGQIRDDDSVIVCFSGGPDSVYVLTHLLIWWRLNKKETHRIIVCHYMHHVRNDDYVDRIFLKTLLPVLHVVSASYYGTDSREAALREARRSRITQVAELYSVQRIITGHTQTDRIETTLLNAVRGCGERGWNGMEAVRQVSGEITINRPLLTTSKDEILRRLDTYQIPYLEDPTNSDREISERNRLRAVVDVMSINYPSDWNNRRERLYELIDTTGKPGERYACTTHPDRGEGVLQRLVDGDRWTFKKICNTIDEDVRYDASREIERERCKKNESLSWLNVGTGWIFVVSGWVYYTTLPQEFWKEVNYASYEWCEGEGWTVGGTSDMYQGVQRKSINLGCVPIFWRTCLPVLKENTTIISVYPLDYIIW